MTVRIYTSKRSLLYATLLSTAMVAVKPVFAQNNNDDNKSDDNKSADNAATTANDEAASTTEDAQPSTTEDKQPESTTEEKDAKTTEDKTTEEEKPTSTEEEESTTTKEEESTTTEDKATTTDTMPAITTDQPTDTDFLTSAPTLTGKYGVPTYAPASVPPTKHAPFMQHSRAPDGTVFIAVGAIMGAFFLGILLWRIIVGLLLHRSVERAAKAQHDVNSKAGFPAPPAPFYKYTDQASTMSLSQQQQQQQQPARNTRRTSRVPSTNASASNLFFSPTAAATGSAGNRASTYLPSGFYAAGAGSNSQNQRHSTSMTNLRPDSMGGMPAARNTIHGTPPDSPAMGGARRDLSATSLNLTRPTSQRAPSAYLDDLLADDPSAFPPQQMPPSTRHSAHLGGGHRR